MDLETNKELLRKISTINNGNSRVLNGLFKDWENEINLNLKRRMNNLGDYKYSKLEDISLLKKTQEYMAKN